MNLTVVTHTNKAWSRDLTKVTASVRDALPENATHEIIELEDGYHNFLQARYDAKKLNDVIVFVDDDDYIEKDSLHKIMEAMNETNAGIVFTNEVVVKEDKEIFNKPVTYYSAITFHPQAIHHMTAFNTKHIHDRSLELAQKYNRGIEWIMRADAAISGGAYYLPINAYYWVQHENQHHKTVECQNSFINTIGSIKGELNRSEERRVGKEC